MIRLCKIQVKPSKNDFGPFHSQALQHRHIGDSANLTEPCSVRFRYRLLTFQGGSSLRCRGFNQSNFRPVASPRLSPFHRPLSPLEAPPVPLRSVSSVLVGSRWPLGWPRWMIGLLSAHPKPFTTGVSQRSSRPELPCVFPYHDLFPFPFHHSPQRASLSGHTKPSDHTPSQTAQNGPRMNPDSKGY